LATQRGFVAGQTFLRYFGISLAFEPPSAGAAGNPPPAEAGCDCTGSCITLPVVFGLLEAT